MAAFWWNKSVESDCKNVLLFIKQNFMEVIVRISLCILSFWIVHSQISTLKHSFWKFDRKSTSDTLYGTKVLIVRYRDYVVEQLKFTMVVRSCNCHRKVLENRVLYPTFRCNSHSLLRILYPKINYNSVIRANLCSLLELDHQKSKLKDCSSYVFFYETLTNLHQ